MVKSPHPSIAVIEDDFNLGLGLESFFRAQGFKVALWRTLREARSTLKNLDNTPLERPDLIVLDWMLSDGQGIDLLPEIKQKHPEMPVLFLTARTELIDRVVGLETGADDYIIKPVEPRELLARVRARLRGLPSAAGTGHRHEPATMDRRTIGRLSLDLGTREVHWSGHLVETTKMEFELLSLLAQRPGRVLTRDEILNQAWGYERFPTTRTIDTHVLQLRQKFDPNLIETVRGVGYKLTVNLHPHDNSPNPIRRNGL